MKILAVLLLLIQSTTFAANKVLFLNGKVTANGKRISQTAELHDGDVIVTDSDSIVIIKLEEGSKIKVSEKSKLILKKIGTKKASTVLSQGQAFFNVVKNF